MNSQHRKALAQTIVLGLVSGMRATFAAGILSHFLQKRAAAALSASKLAFIQSPTAAGVTKALVALEIAGDKLPSTPNRIVAPQVGARVIAGAFAGAESPRVARQTSLTLHFSAADVA